jgi:hypothetical protein
MEKDCTINLNNISSGELLVEAAVNKIKSELNANKEKLMVIIPDLISTLNSSIDVYDSFINQIDEIKDDESVNWPEKLANSGAFAHNCQNFSSKVLNKLEIFQETFKNILAEYNREAFVNINRLNPTGKNTSKSRGGNINSTPTKTQNKKSVPVTPSKGGEGYFVKEKKRKHC